ncbi:MAG: TetR/AcrR family transcriptional regulator [Spirochaetia bacterium]|nr:TetR/AcrR family transcriptional regulator [Spirochaetia bacterium]
MIPRLSVRFKRYPEVNKKEEIIQVTAELLQIQGYFATGINEIVEKSKAPKGSVYHYFKNGKDEIVNEALQYSGNQIKLLLESISLNATNLHEFVNNAFDFSCSD